MLFIILYALFNYYRNKIFLNYCFFTSISMGSFSKKGGLCISKRLQVYTGSYITGLSVTKTHLSLL